jgi:hypothetical protein
MSDVAAAFDAMNAELRARPRAEAVRAALCARFPSEFEHGYRTGYLGENQPPCDAAGYMIGHGHSIAKTHGSPGSISAIPSGRPAMVEPPVDIRPWQPIPA